MIKFLLLLFFVAAPVWAQSQGNIRLVHPWAVGGGIDVVARTLADRLEKNHQYRVTVETRSGANGAIAAAHVARSRGEPVLLIDQTALYLNHHLVPGGMGIDPYQDLVPVAHLAVQHTVITVPWDFPARTFDQLIELAHKQPGKIAFGHSGTGSASRIVMRQIERNANVQFLSVPYKTSANALTDLVGGHIQVTSANLTAATPLAKSQKLRLLAKNDPSALVPNHPDLPAIARWLPFNHSSSLVLFAPATLDQAVLATLRQEVQTIVRNDREFIDRISTAGLVARYLPDRQLQHEITSNIKVWLTLLSDNVINP